MTDTFRLANKLLTLAVVAGMGVGFGSLTAGTAQAAEITKPIAQDCHSNGVPLNYNADMIRDGDKITITTPDNVKVGDEYTIRVNYQPAPIEGKQQGATVEAMKNIVIRFALNNPDAFVTARFVDQGKELANTPKISLVGGKKLVLSDLNVNVKGRDITWAPPTFEITMKALAAGRADTIHQAIEGAAGERNNPENWITMDNVVSNSVLGQMTLPMNCKAIAKGGGPLAPTLASVNIAPNAGKTTAAAVKPKADKKADKKGDDAAKSDAEAAAPTTDADGLTRVDEDIYVDKDQASKATGTPGWLVGLIVVVCLAAAGGIGYGVYRGVKKNKKKD